MADIRICRDELRDNLGQSRFTIIDVRGADDWKGSDLKIKGAIRENPSDVEGWADRYDRGDRIVLYCS